jgi:subtilisin family serine protease
MKCYKNKNKVFINFKKKFFFIYNLSSFLYSFCYYSLNLTKRYIQMYKKTSIIALSLSAFILIGCGGGAGGPSIPDNNSTGTTTPPVDNNNSTGTTTPPVDNNNSTGTTTPPVDNNTTTPQIDNNTTTPAPTTGPGISYTDPSQFPITTRESTQLKRINAEEAYNNGFTGGNLSASQSYTTVSTDLSNRNLQTIIAVLDSGLNGTHESFTGTDKIEAFKDFTATNSSTPYDNVGHGSMVSSIIAGNRSSDNPDYYGVAYGAHLIEGQIINSSGTTDNTTLQNGINWVLQEKALLDQQNVKQVVALNLSLGTNNAGFINGSFQTTLLNALNNNLSIVVAAGNEGLDCKAVNGSIDGQCSFPAAAPWVDPTQTSNYLNNNGGWLVVGSVDTNNVISSFSNKAGVTASNYLVAPGEEIVGASSTNNNGYMIGAGTSFAAPLVSGSLALMAQKWPYLTGRQQAQILLDTAIDLGAPGVDDVYGHGLLNLFAAFNPVGTVAIPAGNTNLTSTNIKTMSLAKTSMKLSSALANLSSFAPLNNTLGVDYYNRDFKMNMTSNIATSGTSPVDFENFMATNYGNILIGVDQSRNLAMIGYKINGTSKLRFSFDNTLLGMKSDGAFSIGQAYTSYLNYEKQFNVTEDIKIKANGTYAYATASTTDNSLISDISTVHALGGKVKAMYDNFGLAYEVPLRAVKGSMNFNTPTSVDSSGNVTNSNLTASLSPNTFQQTMGVFYEATLSNLYFLSAIEHTSDAYGVKGLNNNGARISLNYFY